MVISPPGEDQCAVSQDAHLSQLLEGLLRIFLEGMKINQNQRKTENTVTGCQEPFSQLLLGAQPVVGTART